MDPDHPADVGVVAFANCPVGESSMAPDPFATALDDALPQGWIAAIRILGDRELARDAVQEAATRALAARDRFDPAKPFYPWFYRILRNHCFDLLKSRQRMHPGHDHDAAEDDTAFFARPQPSVEAMLAASEEQRAVLAAIEALKPEARHIIELRHFQDLTYEEMAAVLDCPVGTVMSRLYRARRALRQLLVRTPNFADHGQEG